MTDNLFTAIKPALCYRLTQGGTVFTGEQLLRFLELFWPGGIVQSVILDAATETNEPPTNPDTNYGIGYGVTGSDSEAGDGRQ